MGIDQEPTYEFVVTLHRLEDLESLYDDMETPGGNPCIPQRAVPIHNRRALSPNTHYFLTEREAELLRLDPRVLGVSRTLKDLGIKLKPAWSQYSDSWYKGIDSRLSPGTLQSNDKNWGLLRGTTFPNNDPTWGYDARPAGLRKSGTASTDANGENVDVVIVDGLFRRNHAEFAPNPDGTGGTRVQQINWFFWNEKYGMTPKPDGYIYIYYESDVENSNHGAHVAGIAAGNTQGWARKSTIYNISPYGTNVEEPELIFDYIRNWVLEKPINAATGRKNPTVMNCSFAAPEIYALVQTTLRTVNGVIQRQSTAIREINYRGTLYSDNFTPDGFGSPRQPVYKSFNDLGLLGPAKQYLAAQGDPEYYLLIPNHAHQSSDPFNGLKADIDNLINVHGCHIVAAASNYGYLQDKPGGPDYNNYIKTWGGATYYYNRPPSPQTTSTINVGNLNSDTVPKISASSNRGPGVDIFAPGTGIASSVHQVTGTSGGAADPRFRNSDRINAYDGTSMAAPQVTGVIACLLEKTPTMSPADMKALIIANAKNNLIQDVTVLGSRQRLLGSPNKILSYYSTGGPSLTTSSTTGTTTTTSTTRPPTTTSTTYGPYYILTVAPGSSVDEGSSVEICLTVNPIFITNGSQIPFTVNIAAA